MEIITFLIDFIVHIDKYLESFVEIGRASCRERVLMSV